MKKRHLSREDKAWIVGCLIVAALLFAAPHAFSAATEYPVPIYSGGADSVRVIAKYLDATTWTPSDSIETATDMDTSITLDTDYDWQITTWALWGTDWLSSTEYIRFTSGTVTVDMNGTGDNNVVVYATDGSDTLANVRYTVATGGDSYWGQTAYKLDTFALNDATWTFTLTKPGYVAIVEDSAISANDTLHFTLAQDGTLLTSPSNPSLANVYGWLLDGSGSPLEGAIVKCKVSPKTTNLVDTTASANIIMARNIKPAVADSLGRFSFTVIRSTSYEGADSVFYFFDAEYFGEKIFEGLKIWVPTSGNVNLGDTLAARL